MPLTNPVSMTLPGVPETMVGLAAIERQRQLAQALQQQALQPLQGPQASGPLGTVSVPMSPFQGLAKLLQGYVAGKSGTNLDEKQLSLMKALQGNMGGLFGGGLPVPNQPSAVNQALSNPQTTTDELGTSGGPGPTVQNADRLAQAITSQPPAQQGPLQLPGVDPARSQLMYSAAPDKYMEQLIKESAGPALNQLTDAAGIARGSPEYKSLIAKAITKETHTPLDIVRQNSIALGPSGDVKSYNPPPIAGAFPQFQGGMPTGYAQAPGAAQAVGAMEQAKAEGQGYGGLPYKAPSVIQTEGAPTLSTVQQQIESATGKPVPVPGSRGVQQATRLTAPDDASAMALAKQLSGQGPFSVSVQPPAQSAGGLPGVRLQDQGAAAAQREMGQGIGKEAATTFTNGAAAVQANRQLDNMSSLVQSYSPDKFQSLKATFGSYLQGLGMPEDDVNRALGTNIGDIRALTSQSIQMAGKLTRQTDAQPSQIQFLKNLQSMPNADMTPQGFQKVLLYMKDINNYQIEKMIAQQQWLSNPASKGDPSGFEAAWAQKAKTLPFIWNQQQAQQLQPAARGPLTPQEQQELQQLRKRFGRG